MSKSKKLMLFIVEGETDMISLESTLARIFNNDEVEFEVMHGDITSRDEDTSCNIAQVLSQRVEDYLKLYYIKKSEVKMIVHIVDTDGAFIPPNKVESGTNDRIKYMENRIITRHPQQIIMRNYEKNQAIRNLVMTKKISNIPYRVFFFSRNLEHVLHNNANNVATRDKCRLAYQFSNYYSQHPQEFIDFICNEEVAVREGYEGSWAFIFSRCNSLKRYTNFNVLFEMKGIKSSGL